jgi:peptidyl-prolyl cis-trans isomerase D
MLFAIQGNSLGITVTAEELHDLVAGPHPHQMAERFFNQGNGYDMRLAQQFLENMAQFDSTARNYYMEMESAIEKETYITKYLNLLSKAYYMPKAFARKIQEENSWKAELEIVQVPYSSPLVSDDKIKVNDEDLKKWYEANKYRFKQEQEYRSVDYVIFTVQPSENDFKEIAENVAQTYEEFTQTDEPKLFVNRMPNSRFDSAYHKAGELPPAIDTALFSAKVGTFVPPYIDFYPEGEMWTFAKLLAAETRPDSINVSPIFIGWYGRDQQNQRKKEESQAMVDSAFHAIMLGADFAEVSKKYSDIPYAQYFEDGKIWLVDGIGTEFFGSEQQGIFDTLYNFNTGAIVKKELPGGVLIFKMNERTAMERKIQVAIGRKIIEASTETIESIESAANNFANGTDTYEKFTNAVIKHNLNKRSFDRVEKMTYSLPGTSGNSSREIIKWVYDEETKKGDVSKIYSLENMYVVVAVKDFLPEGYITLENEQVKQYAEAMVKRDKKAEMLEAMLKKSLSSSASITKIAEKYSTMVDTSVISFADRNFSHFGPEGKMIGKIFAQKDTKIGVYKGDQGVYVVKINKFDTPTLDIENSNISDNMYVQQSSYMYQNRIFRDGTKALKKLYKIEDNRYRVF